MSEIGDVSGFEHHGLDTVLDGRLYKGLSIRLVSLRVCSGLQQTRLFSSIRLRGKF